MHDVETSAEVSLADINYALCDLCARLFGIVAAKCSPCSRGEFLTLCLVMLGLKATGSQANKDVNNNCSQPYNGRQDRTEAPERNAKYGAWSL